MDKIGVDAVIVQDMGLLKRIIDEDIRIPVHISTQCDNRDIEKVNFFNKMGVSRVVLARELSLDKIKEIHAANPNLELEAFIHGALCVSYSGQCYLSQYIGGRSANRGECAQPCRKKYSVLTSEGEVLAKDIHALSLRDFNASKHLRQMIENGVYSFKIEGRLKEVGYVKNITAYYRQELDKYSQKSSSGKVFLPFAPNPEKSFNRGFTDYFLEKGILVAPAKAANAGGVAVSGLEMSQNSERLSWSREEVDKKLHYIMNNIHDNCVKYGTEPDGYINYVKGANLAGFLKVAKAMMAQGVF